MVSDVGAERGTAHGVEARAADDRAGAEKEHEEAGTGGKGCAFLERRHARGSDEQDSGEGGGRSEEREGRPPREHQAQPRAVPGEQQMRGRRPAHERLLTP